MPWPVIGISPAGSVTVLVEDAVLAVERMLKSAGRTLPPHAMTMDIAGSNALRCFICPPVAHRAASGQ